MLGSRGGRGDKPALIDGPSGAVTTYAELAERVAPWRPGWRRAGIGPGDAVGLLAPTAWTGRSPSTPSSRSAAIVTSINPLLTADEIAKQLAAAGARP